MISSFHGEVTLCRKNKAKGSRSDWSEREIAVSTISGRDEFCTVFQTLIFLSREQWHKNNTQREVRPGKDIYRISSGGVN